MKYLHKFFQHLNESLDITDLSKEELDEMLLPIKDLEIEFIEAEDEYLVQFVIWK